MKQTPCSTSFVASHSCHFLYCLSSCDVRMCLWATHVSTNSHFSLLSTKLCRARESNEKKSRENENEREIDTKNCALFALFRFNKQVSMMQQAAIMCKMLIFLATSRLMISEFSVERIFCQRAESKCFNALTAD